jgi:hypothetical protein
MRLTWRTGSKTPWACPRWRKRKATEAPQSGSAKGWGTGIGNPGLYQNPTTTTLRSPMIDLTEVAGAALTFAEAVDLEENDVAQVFLVNDDTGDDIGGAIYTAVDGDITNVEWAAVGPIDISAGVGLKVRLEWRFSGQAPNEDYMGWYIDDVVVTVRGSEAPRGLAASALESPGPTTTLGPSAGARFATVDGDGRAVEQRVGHLVVDVVLIADVEVGLLSDALRRSTLVLPWLALLVAAAKAVAGSAGASGSVLLAGAPAASLAARPRPSGIGPRKPWWSFQASAALASINASMKRRSAKASRP